MQRHLSLRRRWTGRVAVALSGLLLWAQASPLSAQSHDGTKSSLEALAARSTPAVVLIDVKTASNTRQGSGFVVDPTGRILTNYHVIRDATSARVKLSSGDVYEDVQILAQDPRRDIAVLQVEGFDMPSLELGNSDSVHIGTPVVLIGSPLRLENTVSTGIISGRRQEPQGYQLLQVSAPASPGSSGGPVLGADGKVVGIAVSQMEGGQNLNFAVPINYARGLLTHLGDKPVAVLRATDLTSGSGTTEPSPGAANLVNQGLSYSTAGFKGYEIDTEEVLGEGRIRRTRTTYRLIETLGASEPQIEEYREGETTRTTEPFGTVQTLERTRSRVVVSADGLRPLSAMGETATWNGSGWVTVRHDLRFQGDRAVGVVTDTSGQTVQMDRQLPPGILLHDVSDLAFALLDADSLVGRSVEFVTFDARTGAIDHERYDVRDTATIQVAGTTYRALRVNVATGLENQTLFVRARSPRVFLRRLSQDGTEVEKLTSLKPLAAKMPPTGNRPPD
jgi:S1-C subfamily serine protease